MSKCRKRGMWQPRFDRGDSHAYFRLELMVEITGNGAQGRFSRVQEL